MPAPQGSRGGRRAVLALAGALVATLLFAAEQLPGDTAKIFTKAAFARAAVEEEPSKIVFYTVGDWGGGTENQKVVAQAMERHARGVPPDFIVSLGDNFYDAGVASVDSEYFKERFETVYNTKHLGHVPWYLVQGDHDHKGSTGAQVAYGKLRRTPEWNMDALYYTFTKRKGAAKVRFLMLDSIGLEGGLMLETDKRRFAKHYDPAVSGKEAGEKQVAWLKAQLAGEAHKAAVAEGWVVAVGHRPVVSACTRARTTAENRTAGVLHALLQDSGVSVYMNGHDHTMQHLRDADDRALHYVVNGGGGYETLHGLTPIPEKVYGDAYYGFCVYTVTQEHMTVDFVDAASGQVQYSVRIPRRDPLPVK
eukprot:TRINITY_DN11707_c0_g2_i1.p1 TRINITY_DN11707_c0_g2~~TRINITY_DN11707_c0_g2_i1.p1  ORF type:complete len:425 (+),score=128.76 TRINITY_DN11707_c0_g2_i1:184-1275(+)